jgi:hypothetical protein
MNFVSYKLCKLFVCLMCFKMFSVAQTISQNLHLSGISPFLLGPFKSVKE